VVGESRPARLAPRHGVRNLVKEEGKTLVRTKRIRTFRCRSAAAVSGGFPLHPRRRPRTCVAGRGRAPSGGGRVRYACQESFGAAARTFGALGQAELASRRTFAGGRARHARTRRHRFQSTPRVSTYCTSPEKRDPALGAFR
jgi:hypothetical protein